MYQNDPCRVLTCEARLSYVNLVSPKTNNNDPNGKAKYSVTLLIPKTEIACIEDINSAINAAAQAGLNTKFGGFMPQFQSILHDGDDVNTNGVPYGDECKGHYVIAASSTIKPQVVHQSNVKAELAPTDIYSGMYGRVTLRFYPYNTANKKGVGCGLQNVMKTRDGDPLGGGTTAANDFADLEQTAAMPAGMPNTGTPMNVPPQQGYVPQATQPMGMPATPQTQQYGMANNQAFPQINPITGQPM